MNGQVKNVFSFKLHQWGTVSQRAEEAWLLYLWCQCGVRGGGGRRGEGVALLAASAATMRSSPQTGRTVDGHGVSHRLREKPDLR